VKFEFTGQIFEKVSSSKLYQNPSNESRVFPRGQMDVTKLIVTFRNFANEPKNEFSRNGIRSLNWIDLAHYGEK
jgi:hypothetical protein